MKNHKNFAISRINIFRFIGKISLMATLMFGLISQTLPGRQKEMLAWSGITLILTFISRMGEKTFREVFRESYKTKILLLHCDAYKDLERILRKKASGQLANNDEAIRLKKKCQRLIVKYRHAFRTNKSSRLSIMSNLVW